MQHPWIQRIGKAWTSGRRIISGYRGEECTDCTVPWAETCDPSDRGFSLCRLPKGDAAS
jgi:hypothetical protein